LARTYQALAQGGRDAFYKGPMAKTMDAYFRRIGGDLRYEDFRRA
jgi:gamma-glutamyltranspeptidase/glutathione hydrolase